MAPIHGSSFVNGLPLRAGDELLKIWLVADRVPGGIDFQTRNGNELTGRACDHLANYFHGVLGPGRRTSVWVEDSCLNGDTMYVQ
jgi:hypothetical protein